MTDDTTHPVTEGDSATLYPHRLGAEEGRRGPAKEGDSVTLCCVRGMQREAAEELAAQVGKLLASGAYVHAGPGETADSISAELRPGPAPLRVMAARRDGDWGIAFIAPPDPARDTAAVDAAIHGAVTPFIGENATSATVHRMAQAITQAVMSVPTRELPGPPTEFRKGVLCRHPYGAKSELIIGLATEWVRTGSWRMRQRLGTLAAQLMEDADIVERSEEYDPWQVAEAAADLADSCRTYLGVFAAHTAPPTKTGAERIAAERERHTSVEGWTPEHDDAHQKGELLDAGLCYAYAAINVGHPAMEKPPKEWPWDAAWWKPASTRTRNLEKAGALFAAEIDRVDREVVRRPGDALDDKTTQ